MAPKHIQSHAELSKHLQEQLGFLQASSEAYDRGRVEEAKRMAASIRVLVHDPSSSKSNSKSLLGQLNQKNIQFYDSSFPYDPRSTYPYMGLIAHSATLSNVSSWVKYAPILDMFAVGSMVRTTDFDTWWNAIIFVDDNGNKLTRKSVVLSVAEQDGGVHVDSSLNRVYADLSRNNSLGFIVPEGKEDWLQGAELASIRQITHEVLKSIIPGYSLKLNKPALNETVATPPAANASPQLFVGRNDPCFCGSGKKYKHCCGVLS
jgi:hypothetical protein